MKGADQSDWCIDLANRFQELVGALSLRSSSADSLFLLIDSLPRPRTFSEWLMLYGLVLTASFRCVGRRSFNAEWFVMLATTTSMDLLISNFKEVVGLVATSDADVNRLPLNARTLIDASFQHRLTAKGLARTLKVSERDVTKAFRDAYGMTTHEYLMRVRVSRALPLLRDGLKIEAVAHEVGYRSKKDFYHAVKSLTGKTPKDLVHRIGQRLPDDPDEQE